MIRNGDTALDAAAARLARAIDAVEARLDTLRAGPLPTSEAPDTETLEIALREARLRERALEAAAAEASTVLGRAAEQIRQALEDEAPGEDPTELHEPSPSLDHLSDDQTDLHPSAAWEF